MTRKMISLASLVMPVAWMVNAQTAQAQSQTQGAIVKWFDDQGDLTDSVIFEDPKLGNVGIGTSTPNGKLTLFKDGPTTQVFENLKNDVHELLIGVDVATIVSAITASDLQLRTNNVTRMWIHANTGNVGIGTANPTGFPKLQVEGEHTAVRGATTDPSCVFSCTAVEGYSVNGVGVSGRTNSMFSPAVVAAGPSFSSWALAVEGWTFMRSKLKLDSNVPSLPGAYSLEIEGARGNGKGISYGWDTFSSRRWKTNIQNIQGALEKIERLRGVSFDWKKDNRHDIGLIAEEVAEVLPEVVVFEEKGKDAMSLDYARLTPLLIEAAKEQQAQIKELRAELKGLKTLKARLEALERSVEMVHEADRRDHGQRGVFRWLAREDRYRSRLREELGQVPAIE